MKMRNRTPLILLLFFASGFSGLVYEVVWMRHLGVVFGNTVYATATVLAGFMGGLAIGSFYFGKVADRHGGLLRLYGILEILVGVCALLFPLVLKALSPFYVWLAGASSLSHDKFSLLQSIVIVCILIIPTALMGGTLPILTKYLSREFRSLGKQLGLLYGLNTFGAVLGCASAGLVLIGAIGVRATTWIAVAITFTVGAAAILISRRTPTAAPQQAEAAEEPPAEAPYPAWLRTTVLFLFAVSGFCAMAYEVLWTRALVFLVGGTSYAFTIMLTTYLLGLALGSVLVVRFVDRGKRLLETFSVLQVLIGLGILATLAAVPLVLNTLGSFFLRARFGDLASFVLLETLIALVFIFPFTVLMGMSFPIVGKLYTASYQQTGRNIGVTYFADTVGCILGSLAAGFLLIPAFGTLGSLRGMSALNLLIGTVALSCCSRGMRRIGFSIGRMLAMTLAVALVCVVAKRSIPDDTFAALFTAPGSRLVYLNEDIGGTVTIEQYSDYKTISINGINVAGTDLKFETTQKLQAHLALLLHPNPKKVMQIGFGSGGTAWAITRHPVEQIDCVEITAAVLKARDEMREVNHGVLEDPRVKVFVDDARSYMLKCKTGYDAILSDSIHPRRAGNGALYSVDYFRLCRAKLNPDGIFSAWLPIYGLSLDDYRVTARSLKQVFPFVYIFHTAVGRNEWSIILGMNSPLKIDVNSIASKMQMPSVRDDLKIIFMDRAEDILACFLLGDKNLGQFLGPSRTLNTDDFPYLEYVAPRSSIVNSRKDLLIPLYRELVQNREPVFPYIVEGTAPSMETVRSSWDSSIHVLNARLLEFEETPEASAAAVKELRTAVQLDALNIVASNLLVTPNIY